MAESFLGEIRMFGGNYAPTSWAYCDGQVTPISQNQALFSLLGTAYGGDGVNAFNLPDLRGRLPMGYGTGPGLTPRQLGQTLGEEMVQLGVGNLPSHTHHMFASTLDSNNLASPEGLGSAGGQMVYADANPETAATLAEQSVEEKGQGTKHFNMMPYLAVHFIISLMGEYPQRN